MALIAVSLLLLCQNTNAQPGYRLWVPRSPYPSNNGPYSYTQRAQQGYNPWMRTDYPQPFIKFGIHFDPLISWFSTDNYDVHSDGAVPGLNFGISYNKYFSPNYSFSSGISIISAGGKLVYNKTTSLELKNYYNEIITVGPGEDITYRIYYLSIPLGLKLQTNQIGYGSFFTDFGLDPKIAVGGRADIPSLNIEGGNAMPDLRTFNLSYHIIAGMEYPFGGFNNIVVGIGFENNFFDVTRDNGNQTLDVVTNKLILFRIGLTF
jgi:hypothetical protein